jgi:hypothetical protein
MNKVPKMKRATAACRLSPKERLSTLPYVLLVAIAAGCLALFVLVKVSFASLRGMHCLSFV